MKKIYFQIAILAILAITIIFSLSTIVNASDGNVAKVGETTYSTLQAAIDAVSTDGKETTVTLLKDTTENITIKNGQNIILDLGTYALTNNGKSDTIYVQLGATLTIKGSGTIVNNTDYYYPLMNNGTTIIDSGTIKKTSDEGYAVLNHGLMTINDGTISSTGSKSALISNGYYNYKSSDDREGYVANTNQADATMTINGGTFSGGKYAVKNDDYGDLVINGGTFSSSAYDIALLNWSEAEINGGTFDGEIFVGDSDDDENWSLEINGGTFDNEYIFRTVENKVPTESVVITDGTFVYSDSFFATVTNDDGSVEYESVDFEISGGTYSYDVSEYLAENVVIEEENGVYSVGSEIKNEVAQGNEGIGNSSAADENDNNKGEVDNNNSGTEDQKAENNNNSTGNSDDDEAASVGSDETDGSSDEEANNDNTTNADELDETPTTGVIGIISYILVATTIAGIGMIALRKKD